LSEGRRPEGEQPGDRVQSAPVVLVVDDDLDIAESIGDYVKSAREAIDETVSHEMNDLRKAIRRHRKHLGI